MNNRITNKYINDKLSSDIKKEETKNSIYNSKIGDQEYYSTKTNLNKKKKILFHKKQKHISIGINFEKLIINTKRNNNYNNSPQIDQINRNLSYNNVILPKKNNNQNNSQSIISSSNKKQNIVNLKNPKNTSSNYNSKYNKNYQNINKGKTFFIRNLGITEETFEKSGNKIDNYSIFNNYISPCCEKKNLLTSNNKLIFKNNSFTSQNKNIILVQSHKIKNCYTNLIINKNDSNKGKTKLKGIPFSLKKNTIKIRTVTENNNPKDFLHNKEVIHPIYKNEKILQNKNINNNNNKVISVKAKYNNEIFLTDKNINENIKHSFCSNFFNKRVSPLKKNGFYISPSKQSIELPDNKSTKIVRKFNLNEESKKDKSERNIDEMVLNKGNNIMNKVSKIKIIHENQKKKYMMKNNKLNKKNIINNINKNKEKNENNKISNISKNEKSSKTINILKNSSFTKINYDNLQKKTDNNIKNSITKNEINKDIIYNNKISKKSESTKDIGGAEDEVMETIEDSLRNSSNFMEINIFHTTNIYSYKTSINSCIKIISKILYKDNIIETLINFCDLETLNKLCLISKKYYHYIKPNIYKIIRQKVFNYNKIGNNTNKNKIKNSLFKYSSLSEMSKILLEKKYKDLLFENKSIYDEQIKKDLTRTIPENLSFQYGKENYNKLYHLLTAYANYNKNIGYAQGLNFLAANCIFIFDKEVDEFLFLDALIQKFNLEYIIGVTNNLNIKLDHISKCLNKYIPKIKDYFGKMNLNYEFFIAGWVLTLFSNSMNNRYLFYIWDYMIIFGWDYFNCFAIAVLKRYENEILLVPQNKLTFYMKNILRNNNFQNDFEIIVKSSFNYLLKEKIFK